MRVASFNIHAGRCGTGANRPSLAHIAEALRAASPDVCFLQEVDRRMVRSRFADQAALLARALRTPGENEWYFAFGECLNFGVFGQYGNALLSRFPLSAVRRRALASDGGEPRGAVGAVVTNGDMSVSVWATHLGLRETWRETQLETLANAVQSDHAAGMPVIVGGDFNAGWDAPELTRFAERTALVPVSPDVPTFPAVNPAHRIDFLLASPGVTVTDAGTVAVPDASDHALIWADVSFLLV